MKSIFTKTRSFVSRLCFLIEKTEKSRRKRMTMGSEKVRGETARGVNSKNSGQTSLLERFRQRSLYSVAVSFVRFLQWFLSILFFGPIQRAWRPFSVGLLQTKLPWNNPKTARIFVVDNTLLCDKLLKSYRSHYPFKINFLGIDCEWVNREGQANAPVALLQIATPLCDCFLIRLHKMEGQMPQSVKELLEDKSVLKFGVGVQDDVKRLSRMFGIDVSGCVDLRHVVQRCRLDDGCQQRNQKRSLDALAKRILGVTMDKSWRIRCSDWEAECLNKRQIEYAMNDALVASHMFLRLVKSKAEERKIVRTAYNSISCFPVEKNGLGTENNFLNSEDINVDESDNEVNSDGPDFSVKVSEDNFNNGIQISDCLLTEGQEPDINEYSNFESGVTEDKNICSGSSDHESFDDSVNNSQGSFSGKGRICGKVIQDFVERTDLESGFCGVTADLNKLELEDAKGYLSREEVIHLLQDPLIFQRASSLCQGVVDLAFKERKRKDLTKDNGRTKECSSEMTNIKPYKRGTVRKSPLYMNCMLAAPDGSRLCTLDRKKADWYIEKGIGHLTSLDPYTVQLSFEPSARPGAEDSYYLNFKDNICVVCGSNQSYMRKNIVPHDYRRHFPLVMKDHHSHDILLMCPQCHCLSNRHDDRLRKELALKYEAPLGNATVARLIEDPELRRVKSAAKALNYAGDRLPEGRRQELSIIVQDHFNAPVLTPEIISQAVALETRKENSNFVSHGLEVVKKIREERKLLEFEKMWRKHFIDTMNPKYLPPLWSVDHRHEGLKEKLEDCNYLE